MTTRREGDPGKAVSLSRVLIAIFFSVAIVAFVTAPLVADDRQDATQLVDKARLSLEGFMSDNNMGAFNDLVKQAQGVFIIPQMLKGAFIVGACVPRKSTGEMRVGPSESACRSWLQTTLGSSGKEPLW